MKRGDLVSVNHRVTEFLASYFDILFALNEMTHPGEKRMQRICAAECQILPAYFEENLQRLQDFVAEHWIAGALIFMGVCVVQVVIALIPGEAVEIAAGVIFGSLWGTVLCLVGITLGSVIVILLVRKFGRKFVESLYPREKS